MKNQTKTTPGKKRRARSDAQEVVIRHNGKIMATMRMRGDDIEFELEPSIRERPGLAVEFVDRMIEAVEQFVDAELNEEAGSD
jgi:hypothetical protein